MTNKIKGIVSASLYIEKIKKNSLRCELVEICEIITISAWYMPQELEILSIYAEYSAKKKKNNCFFRKTKFPLNKNPPDTK